MGKQQKQEEKMKTTRLEKNKNKLDKTTVRQNTTPWPETPNTKTTTERLDTTIQDEKNKKTYNKFSKTTKQVRTLRNMKAPTRSGNWTERRGIEQQ